MFSVSKHSFDTEMIYTCFARFEEIHEVLDDVDDDDMDDEDDVHAITQPGTMAIIDNDIGDQQEILEV